MDRRAQQDYEAVVAKLRLTEQRLDHLMSHSPSVIYTLEVKGDSLAPTMVSENIEAFLGVSPADATYEWWSRSVHPDDLDRVLNHIQRGLASTGYSTEYRMRHVDGTYRWIEDNSRIVHDAQRKPVATVGVWTDITARKRATEALRESERRFREMLSNVDLIAMTLDTSGNVTFCNDYLLRLVGRVRGEVIGVNWFDMFLDQPVDDLKATFRESLSNGTIPLYDQGAIVTADGSRREIRWSNMVLRGTDGEIIGTASIGEDVTERLRADELVRQSQADLERRVQERTAELEAANEQLVAARDAADSANAAKSRFLSRMSHELRTPLNAILGFAQLLEDSPLEDEQAQDLHLILTSGQHLLGLIDDVLDISRIEADTAELKLESVNVSEVVDEALAVVASLAESDGVSLLSDLIPSLHTRVDRRRLLQVLINLLTNAVKYNVRGGSATVNVLEVGDEAVIEVYDTGIGIPAEKLSRLFVPFDRLGAEERGVEGTGLGLALCKSLIDSMGGTIEVSSRELRGSCFRVRLPKAAQPPVAAAHSQPERSHGAARNCPSTVLLIEDNELNAAVVRHMLSDTALYKVIVCGHAEEGIETSRSLLPDLVLLDLHLPDGDGRNILVQLKSHELTTQVPVIVVTADAFAVRTDDLKAAGAYACFTKPFEVPALMASIERALSGVQRAS